MVILTKKLPDSYTNNFQSDFRVSAVSRLPEKGENKGIKPTKATETPGNFPAELESDSLQESTNARKRYMMFFGIYTLSLNEKNELILPNALRETMGGIVFLTRGFDRNLFLLPQEAFHTLLSHVRSTSISDPASRLLRRLFLGNAARVTLNERGRMELPGDLCAFAGLAGQITLVGQGDYLEAWSAIEWEKQVKSLNEPEANIQRFEKFNLPLD